MTKLFVYGTLIDSKRHSYILGRKPKITDRCVLSKFKRGVHYSYPAIYPDSNSNVQGIIIHLKNDEEKAVMDKYEGGLYKAVEVKIGNIYEGTISKCLVYRPVDNKMELLDAPITPQS